MAKPNRFANAPRQATTNGCKTLVSPRRGAAEFPAAVLADELTGIEFDVDAGLIALAYSGDATGNGTLSSLDASRIQQQVVGLDVNSFPDITELLIGWFGRKDSYCVMHRVLPG